MGRPKMGAMCRTRPGLVPVVLLAACLGPVALPVQADICMRQKRYTAAYTVQGVASPERSEIWTYWFGKDRARIDRGNGRSTLVLLDQGVVIDLDHSTRTFTRTPLVAEKAPAGGDTKSSGPAGGVKRTPLGVVSAVVTRTNDTKDLSGRRCRKYLLEIRIPMVESRSEAWVAEDLELDPGLYYTSIYAMLTSQAGFPEMIKELRQIKGVVVFEAIKATMLGANVTASQEVLEFRTATPPPGIYELPSGYNKSPSADKGDKGAKDRPQAAVN